jgi:cis-3-alkyl-4-acyloxetan-2-one decarboxylase
VELTAAARRAADARDWTFGGTWPFEPRWLFTDGVRLHYVDEGPGDAQPVVMLHGNPTWSYLYRTFIETLAEAGYRAVAHDELGFGRSDKPEREDAYSLRGHVDHFAALMDELELDGVTLVVQDWGGPIGLAWAVEHPERVQRLVLLNTWPGGTPPDFPEEPGLFRVLRSRAAGGVLVKRAHVYARLFLFRGERELGDQERAAYLAPHPSRASRAGVLAYARMIPWNGSSAAGEIGRHTEERLSRLADKPVLIVWPLGDRAFKKRTLTLWRARFPDAQVEELEGAGHYVQEDAPERVVPLLLDFLRRT